MLEVVEGKKPNRPRSGFSNNLWNLLLKAWDPEYGSQLPRRPSVSSILDQMEEDADDCDQSTIPPQPPHVEETPGVVPRALTLETLLRCTLCCAFFVFLWNFDSFSSLVWLFCS